MHLASCESCRQALAARLRLREAARCHLDTRAPAGLCEAILRSFAEREKRMAGGERTTRVASPPRLHLRPSHWWLGLIPAPATVLLVLCQPRLTNRGAGRAVELPFSRPAHVVALRFGEPISGNHRPPTSGLTLKGE